MKRFFAVIVALAMVLSCPMVATARESALYGANATGYAVSVQRYYDLGVDMLNMVNQERAKAGLSALAMDQSLVDAAMLRSAEIAILFEHMRPNGQSYTTIIEGADGENIAYGYTSVDVLMHGWMNSPGHRDNILKADFRSVGMAMSNHGGVNYWVQIFSRNNVKTPAVQAPNSPYTYIVDVDPAYVMSMGGDLSSFPYQQRTIDDGGKKYEEGTMFRMLQPLTGEHFYTADIDERNALFAAGWDYEGVAWISPKSSSTPVYRLFNPVTGDHHYTTDANERDELSSVYGWIYEKIGWYSDDAKGTPLYRLYNKALKIGSHHYTADAGEKAKLLSDGWADEGIAWYGK